jgi:hypothetical protein
LDKPLFQLGGKIGVNGLLGLGAVILVRRFAPAEQPCPVQVSVFRGMQTRLGRIVRSGPAFAVVAQVAEYAESLFPAQSEGVKSLAARREFSPPVYAVDKITGHVRIAAQNFRRRFLSAGIPCLPAPTF